MITIDISRNIWEDVLRRLKGAFILIIEKHGKKIGVINPSVNNFLKEYLQEDNIECECIKKYATEHEQIKRGFAAKMEDIIRTGEADLYNYAYENERFLSFYHIFIDLEY